MLGYLQGTTSQICIGEDEACRTEQRDDASEEAVDMSSYKSIISAAIDQVIIFYKDHPEIKVSHGWEHVQRVHIHTQCALKSLHTPLAEKAATDIELASLLHDVDDKKYFPLTPAGTFPNAKTILESIGVTDSSRILEMISWVGCSENGNSVPDFVCDTEEYHWLIPRWSDRLEAVGARGVVRCFQYTREKNNPLFSESSPRPTSEEELWNVYATPERFVAYQKRGGSSTDMISHYYDKLLHIARPPKSIVRNPYLEAMADKSAAELLQVCLEFGRTGIVDEEYILGLEQDG